MGARFELGRRGERAAENFLIARGFKLLERNWRCGHLEVDLIMDGKLAIHFVEVRTLTAPAPIKPYETINALKRRNLIRAASSYVAIKRVSKEVSFDIVSILYFNDRVVIEYCEGAFTPKW